MRSRTSSPPPESDGCTFFPEGPWSPCCQAHDAAYQSSETSRRTADAAFRRCLCQHLPAPVAWAMWLAVRLFGRFHWRRHDG